MSRVIGVGLEPDFVVLRPEKLTARKSTAIVHHNGEALGQGFQNLFEDFAIPVRSGNQEQKRPFPSRLVV